MAAGLLLFAIAPLQRVADKVANVALPNVAEPTAVAARPAAERADAYRGAVRMALADGVVTKAEERALAQLAQALQLGPREAFDLREGVEGEIPGSVNTSVN